MKQNKFLFFFCRIFPALVLVALFIFPLSMTKLDLGNSASSGQILHSYDIPWISKAFISPKILSLSFWLIYFVPITAAFLIFSLFIKADIHKQLYISTFIALTIYLYVSVLCFVNCANTMRWFKQVPYYVYICFGTAFLSHIFMSIYGIKLLRTRNPQYLEYKSVKSTDKKARNKVKGKISIKTKIITITLLTIILVLCSFTVVILHGYKSMITEAISDVGRAKAEQAADIYNEGDGKFAKINPFFISQGESNNFSETPYVRIDIITYDTSEYKGMPNIYLENLETDKNYTLPDFNTFAYTTAIGHISDIPDEEKSIPSELAREYIKLYQSGAYRKQPYYDKKNGLCKYIYPATFEQKAGHKLMGFSVAIYKEEVLMRTYFRTEIFVFTIVAAFIYISILLTLLMADYIANPLLFLKSDVRKTSNALSQVLSKKGRMSVTAIEFKDNINTHDEIKELSMEIEDMVSIMAGIMPYVSFSTIENAEKNTASPTISNRDLCFLFTDIRGFTTLCEDHKTKPKQVVDLLNHYLEIETEIIQKNHGDIDKFVGDEMMAFFAGPKKEFNACKAAMEIRAAMRQEQQESKENGTEVVSIGIGINTGKVVFGSVGSKSRMDFTSIGDTVNLAARLEGANKVYHSKAIITDAVYKELQDLFICRELDFIKVKGKNEPVKIYEILQLKSIADENEKTETLTQLKESFEKGLGFYRKQQWEKAKTAFTTCKEKFNDEPSSIFLDRIEHFMLNPPPKPWDGVFEMKVK